MARTLEKDGITFEPIVGYRMPVVRLRTEQGRVLVTLSFTDKGKPVNPPDGVTRWMNTTAWQAWKQRNG